jgi:hypothetical protein
MQASEVQADLRETLEATRSAVQLEDWTAHFQLITASHAALESQIGHLNLDATPMPSHMRPLKVTRYRTAMENGIGELAKQLAVATELYGEAVDTISRDDPAGIPLGGEGTLAEPEIVATAFLDAEYKGTLVSMALDKAQQVQQLLDAAAHILVQVCTTLQLSHVLQVLVPPRCHSPVLAEYCADSKYNSIITSTMED